MRPSDEAGGKGRGRIGLVLAGGAALGAYEVGVVQHIVESVARDLGRPIHFEVLSGTSAGAINIAALASRADDALAAVTALADAWGSLRIGEVLRPSGAEILSMLLEATSEGHWVSRLLHARGGVLDPTAIEQLMATAPMHRIDDHIRSGLLRSVEISATRVSTGRAVVFHDSRGLDPDVAMGSSSKWVATPLRAAHALASAAIPLLFPPVMIDGEPYCDGGLRQIVPLSPAIRVGAGRLVVINPSQETVDTSPEIAAERRAAVVNPAFLVGKALSALFLDRMEIDLDRAAHTNQILRAGRRRFGPTFDADINEELVSGGDHALRQLATICIQPSRELGPLAIDYITSDHFGDSTSLAGLVLRRLANAGATRAGDLLSYLLFDGGFARALMALGRADAYARHAELCALLADA